MTANGAAGIIGKRQKYDKSATTTTIIQSLTNDISPPSIPMPPARPPTAPATRLSQAGDISSNLLTTSSEPETTSSKLLTTSSKLLTTFSGSYRPILASVPSDTCIRTFRHALPYRPIRAGQVAHGGSRYTPDSEPSSLSRMLRAPGNTAGVAATCAFSPIVNNTPHDNATGVTSACVSMQWELLFGPALGIATD